MNLRTYVLCGLLFAVTSTLSSGRALGRPHHPAPSVNRRISPARLKPPKGKTRARTGAPQTQAAQFAPPPEAASLAMVEAPNPEPAGVWASPLSDSTLDQSLGPSGAALPGNGTLPETIRSFAQPADQAAAPTPVLPAPDIVRSLIGR